MAGQKTMSVLIFIYHYCCLVCVCTVYMLLLGRRGVIAIVRVYGIIIGVIEIALLYFEL